MPSWADATPLLTLIIGTIGTVFGYMYAEKKRKTGIDEAATPPVAIGSVGQGLVDQTKLDTVLDAIETLVPLVLECVTLLKEQSRERHEGEMMEKIIQRLKRNAPALEPRPDA